MDLISHLENKSTDPDWIAQCKLIIKLLKNDLMHEKSKNKSLETIIQFNDELKEDNSALIRKLKIKTKAIHMLQNRLLKVGEDPNVSIQDEGVLLLGPSRHILDSIAEENIKLKESLRFLNIDPSVLEKLQKDNSELRSKYTKLEKELTAAKKLNVDLQRMLQGSSSVKDQEIMLFHKKVDEFSKSRADQSMLCDTLCQEVEMLREKCRDLTLMSSQYQAKLTEVKSGNAPQSVDSGTKHRLDEVEKINAKLQTDLSHLNKQYQEVVAMNTKWQSYDAQREQEVTTLNRQLIEAKDRLSKQRIVADPSINERIDKLTLGYKDKIAKLEEQVEKVEGEVQKLKLDNHHLQQQCEEEQKEKRELFLQIQDISNRGTSNMDKEEMEVLRQQLSVFQEDYEHERRDKDSAISKIAQLEKELYILKSKQQGQNRLQDIPQQRRQTLEHYRNDYFQQHPQHMSSHFTPVSDSNNPENSEIVFEEEGFDIIDSIPANMLHPRPNQSQQTPVFVQSMSEEPKQTKFPPVAKQSFSSHIQHSMSLSPQPTQNTWPGGQHPVLKQSVSEIPLSDRLRPPHIQKAMSDRVGSYGNSRAENNFESQNIQLSYSLGNINEFDVEETVSEFEPPKQAETLKCPQCSLGFPSDQYKEYYRHLSDCI